MPCSSTSTFSVGSSCLFLYIFYFKFRYILKYNTKGSIFILLTSMQTDRYSGQIGIQYLLFCLSHLAPKKCQLFMWLSTVVTNGILLQTLIFLRLSCKLQFRVFVPRFFFNGKTCIYILLNEPVACIKWFSIWAPQQIILPWILSH